MPPCKEYPAQVSSKICELILNIRLFLPFVVIVFGVDVVIVVVVVVADVVAVVVVVVGGGVGVVVVVVVGGGGGGVLKLEIRPFPKKDFGL